MVASYKRESVIIPFAPIAPVSDTAPDGAEGSAVSATGFGKLMVASSSGFQKYRGAGI